MRPATIATRLPAGWHSGSIRPAMSATRPITGGRPQIPHLRYRQQRPASNFPSSSRSALHGNEDFLPEFKPPPISARLRPLIPFFIYWCMITSLAVHLLRARIHSKEELDKAQAQISVLEGLMERYRSGESISQDELRRELEMVGLRERVLTKPEEGEGGDVGWFKAIFGRRGVQDDEQKADEDAVEQWAKVVNEATSHSTPPPTATTLPTQPERTGSARRAPSSKVYM